MNHEGQWCAGPSFLVRFVIQEEIPIHLLDDLILGEAHSIAVGVEHLPRGFVVIPQDWLIILYPCLFRLINCGRVGTVPMVSA